MIYGYLRTYIPQAGIDLGFIRLNHLPDRGGVIQIDGGDFFEVVDLHETPRIEEGLGEHVEGDLILVKRDSWYRPEDSLSAQTIGQRYVDVPEDIAHALRYFVAMHENGGR